MNWVEVMENRNTTKISQIRLESSQINSNLSKFILFLYGHDNFLKNSDYWLIYPFLNYRSGSW